MSHGERDRKGERKEKGDEAKVKGGHRRAGEQINDSEKNEERERQI